MTLGVTNYRSRSERTLTTETSTSSTRPTDIPVTSSPSRTTLRVTRNRGDYVFPPTKTDDTVVYEDTGGVYVVRVGIPGGHPCRLVMCALCVYASSSRWTDTR